MSSQGILNVAGFYRRRAGLIDVEEVDFPYDDAPHVAVSLIGLEVPSQIWWFAEIPYSDTGGIGEMRLRVFSLDSSWVKPAVVERIEQQLRQHFARATQ